MEMEDIGDKIQIITDKEQNEKQKDYLKNCEIQTEGVKNIIPGITYQLLLLMLFLWRATKIQYFSFRLGSELKEAEKFDDVVFQYQEKENDKLKLRLVQIKHIESKKYISESDLLSLRNDNNFSIQKYFHSYLRIKKLFLAKSIYSIFYKSEIEDMCICTNIDLENGIKKNICFDVDTVKKLCEFIDNISNDNNCDGFNPLDIYDNRKLNQLDFFDNRRLNVLDKRKFDINASDKRGFTPLVYAIKGRKIDIIKYLISEHAHVNKPDIDGLTPLSHAKNIGDKTIIEMLDKSER